MSDTIRASEATGRWSALPGLAGAEQPITAKKRWAYRMWNVGRVLATVAVILLLYSYWAPWVVMRGVSFVGDQEYHYTLTLGPGDVDALLGQAIWSGLIMLLVIFCILIWQRRLPVLMFACAYCLVQFSVIFDRLAPDMPTFARQDGYYIRLIPGSVPADLDGNPVQQLPGLYSELRLIYCLGRRGSAPGHLAHHAR